MEIVEHSIDDLLRKGIQLVIAQGERVTATKGAMLELQGVLMELHNPRARLSRAEGRGTLFSCLGELLWYLAGSNALSFIKYHVPKYKGVSDDGLICKGAYGPRLLGLRGIDQVESVITLLKKKPTTRQAVIQLFNAEDLAGNSKDVPCTCTLQFLLREQKLHLIAHMRSNDIWIGLPHDVFAFTMLQELIARTVEADLGSYKHLVGSLHLYDKDRNAAQRYLDEGVFSSGPEMPSMPTGSPWEHLEKVLEAEQNLREHGLMAREMEPAVDSYWADFIRLLEFRRMLKDKARAGELVALAESIHDDYYRIYLRQKIDGLKP